MTDVKRTLSSTAIATSHLVLEGRVPNSRSIELNTYATNIQSILLSVLLTRELPGDRDLFSGTDSKDSKMANIDTDLETTPYFPEVDENVTADSAGLTQYYKDYMNELFHLALRILPISGSGCLFSRATF